MVRYEGIRLGDLETVGLTFTVHAKGLSVAVDRRVPQGYLAREAVEGDRRAVRLCLTATGSDALMSAETAMADRLAPLVDSIESRAAFVQSLDQIDTQLKARFKTKTTSA